MHELDLSRINLGTVDLTDATAMTAYEKVNDMILVMYGERITDVDYSIRS